MAGNQRVMEVCNEVTSKYESYIPNKLNQIKHTEKTLTIFHQNICDLNKKEELSHSLMEHPVRIICLTEHHLHDGELEGMIFNKYALGAKFCRKAHKGGDVCILIDVNLHFTNINMDKYSEERDDEICAIRVYTPSCQTMVMTVYRSPTGDITNFLNTLETTIDKLYNNTTNLIICGDFNINYLSDNKEKQKLNSLLNSYSLYSVIEFPTRTKNTTSTAIDNVFINNFKHENYKIYPLIKGLSDHDVQVLNLYLQACPTTEMSYLLTGKLMNTH